MWSFLWKVLWCHINCSIFSKIPRAPCHGHTPHKHGGCHGNPAVLQSIVRWSWVLVHHLLWCVTPQRRSLIAWLCSPLKPWTSDASGRRRRSDSDLCGLLADVPGCSRAGWSLQMDVFNLDLLWTVFFSLDWICLSVKSRFFLFQSLCQIQTKRCASSCNYWQCFFVAFSQEL